MRTDMVGTHWLCVTRNFSIAARAALGVEFLKDHNGRSDAIELRAVVKRSTVVERGR